MLLHRDDTPRAAAKGIQSIEVGYRVLLAIQRGPGSLQLVEIAKRAALSPGSAHNYLVSLVRTGLVEQEARGLYRLGPSAFALSLASFRQLGGYEHVREEADILHQITGQSTAVSVWSQAGPVSVYIRKADEIKNFEFRPGLVPMLRSGVGLLYMGYLSADLTKDIVERELHAAHRTEAAETLLREARLHVRSRGYAFFDRPDEAFIHAALAAPVWDGNERIAFALDILGSSGEIAPDINAHYLAALQESAERASMRLSGTTVSNSVSIER